VRDFVNLKTPAAKLKHLRHERHSVKLTVLIESPQNLFFATDFYPLADGQVLFCLHHILGALGAIDHSHNSTS
jgi:hypothetical protein